MTGTGHWRLGVSLTLLIGFVVMFKGMANIRLDLKAMNKTLQEIHAVYHSQEEGNE